MLFYFSTPLTAAMWLWAEKILSDDASQQFAGGNGSRYDSIGISGPSKLGNGN
jgi:hypothetical protein